MIIVINNFKCPTWNSIYSSPHWSTRAKQVNEMKKLGYHLALAERNKQKKEIVFPFKNKVNLDFEIHYKDNRRRDIDNAFIKPFLDSLVLVGILKDDNTRYIKKITLRMKVGQLEDKVIININ